MNHLTLKEMAWVLEAILRRKFVTSFFGASAAFIISAWIWAYRALGHIPQPLIIHFNSREGINQIGNLTDLSQIAITSIMILVINFLIAPLCLRIAKGFACGAFA